MNTTEFLALCESNKRRQANVMVAEAAGWQDIRKSSFRPSIDMGVHPTDGCRAEVPNYVGSLDAAWALWPCQDTDPERTDEQEDQRRRMERALNGIVSDTYSATELDWSVGGMLAAICPEFVSAAFLQAHSKLDA